MQAEGHWRSLDKIIMRERLKRQDDRKKKRENDKNPKKGSHDWHMSKPCRKFDRMDGSTGGQNNPQLGIFLDEVCSDLS